MDYERQWQMIMEDNMFSEDFTLTSDDLSFSVRGVFCSGTHEEAPTASYGVARFVNREYLSVSLASLPEAITDPSEDLRLAIVENPRRGQFRVSDISGARSGMVVFSLQPINAKRGR